MDAKSRIDKIIELQRTLGEVLNEVHQTNYSSKFWDGALYWFAVDILKSKGRMVCSKKVPYDNIAFKEMFKGDRKKRLNRNYFDNIIDIAKIESRKKIPYFILLVINLFFRYSVYRLTNYGSRKFKRKRVVNIANKTKDYKIKNALTCIPKFLIEDFSFYKCININHEDPFYDKLLKNGFAVSYMNRQLHHKKVKLCQHGAFYGEVANHSGTDIYPYFSDEFYTWGWQYLSNHIPSRSPLLDRFEKEYSKCRKNSILTLIVLPSLIDLNTENNLIQITNLLNSDKNNLMVRARPSKLEYERKYNFEFVKKIVGNKMKIDDGETFINRILQTRIVMMLSHPGTIFLQCIRIDKPVMAIAMDLNDYHELYRPYVEFFIDQGILHLNAIKMIDKYNEINNDIENWWNSIITENMYKKYKKNYCGCIE